MKRIGAAPLARGLGFAAVYAFSALMLAWMAGGQGAFGRIDAALAIPLLMPGAVALAWLVRNEEKPQRYKWFLTAVAVLLFVQMLLHLLIGSHVGAGQLVVTALAGYFACRVASALLGRLRAKAPLLRGFVLFIVCLLWFAVGQAFLWQAYGEAATGAAKPKLAVLTGLPLRWAGGGDMAAILAEGPSDAPVISALGQSFNVHMVDSVGESAGDEALLVAHPRALTPEDMVRLDQRARGKAPVVILADALSTWPPAYPLGDPRNPPVTSLLTPMFDHWRMTLAAPQADRAGEVEILVGAEARKLRLHSAGRFTNLPRDCRSFGDGRVVQCRLPGSERALWVVGDADMLHASLWQSPLSLAPWLVRSDNLSWLVSILRSDDRAGWFAPIWIR